MKGKYAILFLALFAMALLVVPTAARAGTNLGMQLASAPDTKTACDNDVDYAGCVHNEHDLNGALGKITISDSVGGWDTNVTSGFGPPFEHFVPLLDISTFNASTSGGQGPLTVLLSVSSLSSFSGVQTVLDHIGGTNSFAGTTITTQAWLSAANTPFCGSGCGGAVALTPLLTLTGLAYSGMVSGGGVFPVSPFAITLEVTIDAHGNADTTSFDNEFDIPEPATLSVLGAGLLGLGTGIRRKLLRA